MRAELMWVDYMIDICLLSIFIAIRALRIGFKTLNVIKSYTNCSKSVPTHPNFSNTIPSILMKIIFYRLSVRIKYLSQFFHHKHSCDSITNIKHLSNDCDKVSEKARPNLLISSCHSVCRSTNRLEAKSKCNQLQWLTNFSRKKPSGMRWGSWGGWLRLVNQLVAAFWGDSLENH